MSLSTAEIEAVVGDLAPRLTGGRIERIDQPDPLKLVLKIRKDAFLYSLLICVHPQFSRLHLLTARRDEGKPAAGFCNVLRQHISSTPVQALQQVPNDRVVVIETFEHDRVMRPHRIKLVAELMGPGSNLLLLDESDRIIGALFREDTPRRKVVPGAQYQPLPPPGGGAAEKSRANRFAEFADADDPLALSRAIQAHYARLEAQAALAALQAEVLHACRTALKSRQRLCRKLQDGLRKADEAETVRRKGELLKIVLGEVAKGQREVVVEDLFEPARPKLVIELDPLLTPERNLEALFARYKKAKAGRGRLAAEGSRAEREATALEALEAKVQKAGSVEDLEALKMELGRHGVRFAEDRARVKRADEPRGGPRSFHSAEGLEILVARNARDNEHLTFTVGRGNDYWMHLLDWPGPHVVIRKPSEKSVGRETLLDAAHLAVHFSKIRGTDFAQVTYTQCKNVRRFRGAKQGTVSYSQASTLQVRLEPERLERLLARRDAGPVDEEGPEPVR